MTARRIVFVIFDGLQPIDLVGPHEAQPGRRARGGGITSGVWSVIGC
jgi:hypothetical protein